MKIFFSRARVFYPKQLFLIMIIFLSFSELVNGQYCILMENPPIEFSFRNNNASNQYKLAKSFSNNIELLLLNFGRFVENGYRLTIKQDKSCEFIYFDEKTYKILETDTTLVNEIRLGSEELKKEGSYYGVCQESSGHGWAMFLIKTPKNHFELSASGHSIQEILEKNKEECFGNLLIYETFSKLIDDNKNIIK